MTIYFKKSFLQCKEVKEFVRKSQLDEFKRRILEHLDALEAKEKKKDEKVQKALIEAECLRKAGYPVGTVREWKGKKFIKVAPNKWKPKYEKDNTRGAKQSIAAIKKKISACESVDELLQVVKENKHRFKDESGQYLPFVKEMFEHAGKKHKEIKGGAKAGKKEGASEAGKQASDESKAEQVHSFISDQFRSLDLNSRFFGALKASLGKKGGTDKYVLDKMQKEIKIIVHSDDPNYSGEKCESDEELKDSLETLAHCAADLAKTNNRSRLATFAENIRNYIKAHFTAAASGKGKEEKPAIVRSPGIMKIRAKYEASPSVEGRKKTVVLPNGEKVICHFRIVEADAPTARHFMAFG